MAAVEAITDPCLVFALRREAMYFRRAYPYRRCFPGAPCRAQWRGTYAQQVLMLETGVGAAAMTTALRWCLSEPRFDGIPYRPNCLISLGFSGALQAELQVGELVVATEIVDLQNQSWPTQSRFPFKDYQTSFGRLLSVPELIGDPQEKRRLGERYGALAVDMESAVAARLCHEHNVPFACLRVISDDWNTPLSPHLLPLLRKGRVSLPRLLATVARHPTLIGELLRLARCTRAAARKLAQPLSTMRETIHPECE